MDGKVILVGAGPGGPNLMTVRGQEALRSAEVVVYDRLLDPEILELIPENAERINVGKNAGNHPVPQQRINEILLEKALEGKRVVRLKGGDSFVFGRGGEELELLWQKGVAFEVVPGITSALAAPTFAGIPVTHRDYSSSVHIITGHRRQNASLTLDYDALVRLDGTLVFLMALASFPEIARGLISAGMPADFPCAIIENGARPEQRRFVTTVGGAEECISQHNVQSPAIFVVGRVCSLAGEMDWFNKLPYRGKRVLVVPPGEGSHTLADRLRAQGMRVKELPAPRRERLSAVLPEPGGCLLLTSTAAVEALFGALDASATDVRALAGIRLICGGRKTEKALRARGLLPDESVPGLSAEQMLASCAERCTDVLCSEAEAEVLSGMNPGIRVSAAWREILPEAAAMDWRSYDCIALTTLSGVRALARMAEGADLTGLCAVCIGERVEQAAGALGLMTLRASEMTIESVAESVEWICNVK